MVASFLAFIVVVFSFQVQAGLKAGSTRAIAEPFYLEGNELKKLKSELIKMKFTDDNFVLKFVCDKQKKDPKARSRTINCLAVSVAPEPVAAEPRPKRRRR